MEREQFQNQIRNLLQAVETLLESNTAMGERMAQLEKIAKDNEDLRAEIAKLKGELAMRKRGQHGKKIEKPKDTSGFKFATDIHRDMQTTKEGSI